MTDVPEHLLRRSQERRAALGGGGGEGGGEPPATPGEAPGTEAAASAVEPAGGTEVAAAAAAPVEEPPKPLPPYVQAAIKRPKVPKFAVPVLAALPIWALVYAGTFATPAETLDPELALGKEIYVGKGGCSGCHGAGGEGGTGRPLGEVLQTFPNKADHIAWVVNGSPAAGTPYGAPDRPGGQRVSQSGGFGAMPGFEGTLTEEEIAAVVRYEREELGGGEPEPTAEGETAEGGTGSDSGGGSATNARQQGGQGGETTSTSAGTESTSTTTKTDE